VFQTGCSKGFDVTVTYSVLRTSVDLWLLSFLDGFSVETVNGMLYNPLLGSWSWVESRSINYAIHAVKSGAGGQPSPPDTPLETGGEQHPATAGTTA